MGSAGIHPRLVNARRLASAGCLLAGLCLCAACASARPAVGSLAPPIPPPLSQLPALSDIPAHQTAAVNVINPAVPAAGAQMVSAGVTLGGTTTATAGADSLEYVIYALGPYDATTQPRYILLDLAGGSGTAWAAVSNYTKGSWEWVQLNEPVSAAVWLPIPRAQAFRSSDGMMFVALAVYDGAKLSFSGGTFIEDPPFNFSAQYRRIATEDSLGEGNLELVALSGDGQKVITCNFWEFNGLVHTMDASGGNVIEAALPGTAYAIYSLCVNHDGSRAFLTDQFSSIYKVEGATATRLWVFEGISQYVDAPLCCDAAGDYVYFSGSHSGGISDHDLWRASQTGALEKLVDDDAVHAGTLTALSLGTPYVSGDGGVLAFDAYYAENDTNELYVLDHGTVRQLTNHADGSRSLPRAVSGDGSTIVFSRTNWDGPNSLYAIAPDGTGLTDLGPLSYNYQGGVLTDNGNTFFFADKDNLSGVLLNTATAARFQLATSYPISLSALEPLSMSADGSRLCQRHDAFGVYGIQIADLNPAQPAGTVPLAGPLLFSPPQMVRTYPTLGVVVEVAVSDPQGVSTITGIGLSELLDGREIGLSESLPLFWELALNDKGQLGDRVAGDGIFTSVPSTAGALLNTVDEMTVRIAVQDEDYNVFFADTVLQIIGVPAASE